MILSIFDFDGTLARADGTWVTGTVNAARKAYGNGYSVLMTGRPEFQKAAITKTLMDRGIYFHRIITVGPLFVGSKKQSEITRIVGAVSPDSVEIWDDEPDLLMSYGRLLDGLGIDHRLHLVRG